MNRIAKISAAAATAIVVIGLGVTSQTKDRTVSWCRNTAIAWIVVARVFWETEVHACRLAPWPRRFDKRTGAPARPGARSDGGPLRCPRRLRPLLRPPRVRLRGSELGAACVSPPPPACHRPAHPPAPPAPPGGCGLCTTCGT